MTNESESAPDQCCAPSRDAGEGGSSGPRDATEQTAPTGPVGAHDDDFVDIAGGAFIMGTNEDYRYPGDGEGPAREITLGAFRIAKHSVSNAQFAAFMHDTKHQTEAEKYEWSFVYHLFLPDDFPDTRAVEATPWWRQVYGADWAHPAGPAVEPRRTGRPSGRPRGVDRCLGLLHMGRGAAANRSRMGDGRTWWPRTATFCVG